MMDLAKLKNAFGWSKHRKEIETAIRGVIGKMPEERVDVQVKTVDEMEFRGYTRRRVNYFVNEWERVSAWLFIPDGKEETPAILCCHRQSPHGKEESAGLEGEHQLAFAQHYAELGYVTLAPDCITTGDRMSSRSEPWDTKSFYKDNPAMSLLGKMLSDHRYALDVFQDQKRVDTARIGVIGHGLGAANALLLAAFDDRVQACVASCGFTRFSTDKNVQRWIKDGSTAILPGLAKHIEDKSFPFDWEHILAMSAPSALQIMSPVSGSEYSNPRSCKKAATQAGKVYKLLGAGGAINHFEHHDGHVFTPELLEMADEWFERWL
jgi:dienelactone hydrolase